MKIIKVEAGIYETEDGQVVIVQYWHRVRQYKTHFITLDSYKWESYWCVSSKTLNHAFHYLKDAKRFVLEQYEEVK